MDEGNLPVGHIQRVKVAPWDEISKERLGLTTSRPVADDDPGAAEVEARGSTQDKVSIITYTKQKQ